MQTQKRYRLDKPEHTEFRIYHTALRRAFRRNEDRLWNIIVDHLELRNLKILKATMNLLEPELGSDTAYNAYQRYIDDFIKKQESIKPVHYVPTQLDEARKVMCQIVNHYCDDGPYCDEKSLRFFKAPYARKLINQALNEGKLSEVGVCLARYAKANLKSVLA